MTRLLIATTNRGKLREIAELLAGAPIELVTLAAWPGIPAPEEIGATFAENARAKALYYAAHTAELTVAEDSGLEIEALGGAPGVTSARFGGAETSYPEKFALIYEALDRTGGRDSPARFVCALALAAGNSIVFEAKGAVEGRIASEPRGHGGLGYDPIFFYAPFGRTLGEVSEAEKSAVSHRGQAFRALRDYLTRTSAVARGDR